MKLLFFVNDKYLGQTPLPDADINLPSILWVCETCGEVYARLPVQDSPAPMSWFPWLGCCEKCKPHPRHWNQVPGSIMRIGKNNEHNKLLPEKVMQRELELTIKAYESGQLRYRAWS